MPTQTTDLFLLDDLEDLGRTSELAESDLDALHAVADWIKTFVGRPHDGRAGPVRPFAEAPAADDESRHSEGLHFHDSTIFAVLFHHRTLLQFRGLGHARLGPVSVRKPPWFPDECRALRRVAERAENGLCAGSFSTGPEARVLLAMQKVEGSNPFSRFGKGPAN
jgi:hypothetical protein